MPASYVNGAAVSIMIDTTGAAGTVEAEVKTGTQVLRPRTPVQAGGVAGVIPSPLNNQPLTFIAQPSDELAIIIDELTGVATPTVNGLVEIEPV